MTCEMTWLPLTGISGKAIDCRRGRPWRLNISFGTFKKAQRVARKGRNPQTGEVIEIAASESLAFKSGVKY